MITLEQFRSLASSANVIPLHRTMLADMHTPVSAYLALRESGRPSFLFESVEPDESIGRFSFVGIEPIMTLRARGAGVECSTNGTTAQLEGNIFDALNNQAARYRQAQIQGIEGFLGGFVGYIGYPAVGHLERVPLPEPESDQESESVFGLFTSILRFDHRRQTVTLVHNVIVNGTESLEQAYERGRARLDAMELKFLRPPPSQQSFSCDVSGVGDKADHDEFCAAVRRAKAYIVEGDIFQVVLSRRVRVPFSGDLFAAYRALRIINPSPYLFHLEFGQTQLSGSSPEVLVRVLDSRVEVLPIAGTRRRGSTPEEDH
ncbi:MAG TPA: chorismate-binding protein, partial [Bacteroidota bacterium]|nr:chorismate-binding protein [Bacteroidota bacterium]